MKKIRFMHKIIITFILLLFLISKTNFAQSNNSPYQWEWSSDGPWIGIGLGASVGGLLIGDQKKPFTIGELNGLNKNDVFILDRFAAGNYSKSASTLSDYPFYGSFVLPFTLLADTNINQDTAIVLGLYLESLATTSALFTVTAGLVDRPRPLVFSLEAPLERRLRKTSKRSFYSGHVAACATALFFTAKVYSDYHPYSKWKPYIWSMAFTVPAVVGYLRLKAGKHYISDILLGYTLGALTGCMVPKLHEKKKSNFKFSTNTELSFTGQLIQNMSIKYLF